MLSTVSWKIFWNYFRGRGTREVAWSGEVKWFCSVCAPPPPFPSRLSLQGFRGAPGCSGPGGGVTRVFLPLPLSLPKRRRERGPGSSKIVSRQVSSVWSAGSPFVAPSLPFAGLALAPSANVGGLAETRLSRASGGSHPLGVRRSPAAARALYGAGRREPARRVRETHHCLPQGNQSRRV